jgi:hypothetical protein
MTMEFYRNKHSGALFVEHPVQTHVPSGMVLLIDPEGHQRQCDAHLFLALDALEPGEEPTPVQRQAYVAALQENYNTTLDYTVRNLSRAQLERLQNDPSPERRERALILEQRFLTIALDYVREDFARRGIPQPPSSAESP